ncbi:MAG: hypothetical protein HZA36_02435 [Parcubacteria group bacterium]|nr:hypothetical protein [Parcubacteria group bacterium]
MFNKIILTKAFVFVFFVASFLFVHASVLSSPLPNVRVTVNGISGTLKDISYGSDLKVDWASGNAEYCTLESKGSNVDSNIRRTISGRNFSETNTIIPVEGTYRFLITCFGKRVDQKTTSETIVQVNSPSRKKLTGQLKMSLWGSRVGSGEEKSSSLYYDVPSGSRVKFDWSIENA